MRVIERPALGCLLAAAAFVAGCGEDDIGLVWPTDDGNGDPAWPTVYMAAADPAVSEPGGTTTVSVTRVGGDTGSSLDVTISVSGTHEVDDCSIGGLSGNTVTFAPGVTEVLVSVTALDDFDVFNETVIVAVEPGVSYFVGVPSGAAVILVDDDPFALVASESYSESQPVWSPDGTRIAYLAYPTGVPPGVIRVANVADGVAATIYGYANRCLDWKGDHILFTKAAEGADTGDGEVWKVRYDGTGPTQLTFTNTNGIRTTTANPSFPPGDGVAVYGRLSPDGSLIAFNAHNGNGWYDTFVCNADGTDGWVLVEDQPYSARSTWTPDGSKVLFRFGNNYDQPHSLRTCTWPDQATYATLVGGLPTAPVFGYSPDGTKIVYTSGTDADHNLSVMDSDGTNPTDLLAESFHEKLGGGADRFWSPDGQRIVFDSDRTGNRDVHVINVDGTGLTQVTGSEGDNYDASWSPDGSMLLFITDRNGNFDIVVMPAP